MLTSIPDWALITTAAVSTARRAPIVCPMKSGIARRVEHLELLAGVVEVDQRRLDGVLVVLFFFVEVADARAVIDAGRPVERAGGEQQA